MAYVSNGIQFVRLIRHEWADTTGVGFVTELGGESQGPDALCGMTLEAVADVFSSNMEECQNFEILDISDARAICAHTDGLTLHRSNVNQLALQNTSSNNSGDLDHGLKTTAPQTIFRKLFC